MGGHQQDVAGGKVQNIYFWVVTHIYIDNVDIIYFMDETTTIRVTQKTKERLEKKGSFGESFDDLLNRLLDSIEA